jgi:mannosylglycerate hydrolase
MQVDENTWDNGRIILEAGSNGTITITDQKFGLIHSGLLVFEDEADIGDGWSYIAPLKNETIRSTGVQATISTVFEGRFQTRIRIKITLRIPKSIENGEYSRSEEFVELPVTTYIDLKKDEPFYRLFFMLIVNV